MSSKDIAIVAVFCTAIVGMLLRPVLVAWARKLSATADDAGLGGEVDDLRHRVAELEGANSRLQELEERVDFAERMLAQRVEQQALPINRTPA